MHIEIATDIIDALLEAGEGKSEDRHQAAVRVIRDAQRALTHGTQLITITPEAIGTLRQINNMFLPWELEVFDIVEARYYEIDALLSKLKTHVLLTFLRDSGTRIILGEYEYLVINPLTDLGFSCANRTTLIGENLADCALFECISRWYLKEHKLPHAFSARAALGGGNTIIQVIEQEVNEKSHAVIAIVDSDKKFPGEKLKITARTVKNKQGFLYRNHVISEVSEAENLLPQFLIRNGWHKRNGDKRNSFYNRLKNKKFSFEFLDLKKGMTFAMFSNKQLKSYWEEQWETDIEKLRGVDHGAIEDDNRKIILGAMAASEEGAYLAKMVTQLNDTVRSTSGRIGLTNAQQNEWNKIGDLMLDLACCYETDGRL